MRVPIDGLDLTVAPFSHPPSKVDRVPVLRVFGATREGQRACVHIHQVLPYLYVPYDGPVDQHQLSQHMYTLGRSLNKSLAIALKIPEHRANQAQFIAAITLVKGIPFYGFHYSYSHFLKIYVLDPNNLSRVADLLSRGVVMGRKMQTFESHIPYLPQFFIDHNLLGMDYLRIAGFKFRRPLPPASFPPSLEQQDKPNYFTTENIPDVLAWPENAPINRESYCEIELDVVGIDILNRYEIPERPRKPLIQLFNGSEKIDTKLVPSLKGIWEDETKRRANRNLPPTPPTPVPDASQPEPITKDALMNVLLERIENSKRLNTPQQNDTDSNNATINSESRHSFPELPENDGIPTAFQAIGAMYFGGEVGNQNRTQTGVEPTPSDLKASQTAASEKNIDVFVRLSQSASELSELDAEADEPSEAADDYDFFDDECSELMQHQIAALDAYERQQADVPIELHPLRQQHGDSIHQILIKQDSKPSRGPSGAKDRDRLDQNDGPGSMTPRGDKRKKEVHPAHEDDIEDSDEETNSTPDAAPHSFISKVDGMWSSPPRNSESEKWSFFHDPPDAQSPEEGSTALEDDSQVKEMDSKLPSDDLLSSNPLSSTSWSLPAAQAHDNAESGEIQDALNSSPQQPLSGTSALSEPILIENSSGQSSQQSNIPRMLNIFRFAHAPPTLKELEADWCGEPEREYLDPFFSDPADVSKSKTFSNRRYEVKAGSDRSSLPLFRTSNCSKRMYPNVGGMNDLIPMETLKETFGVDERAKPYVQGLYHDFAPAWTLAKGPPSMSEVKKWVQENPCDPLKTEDSAFVKNLKARKSSQIEGPTQKNKFGYKYSQIQTEVLDHELQHLVVMSVEILTHAMTESERLLHGLPKLKLPDPKVNGILACFYCFQGQDERIGRANGHRAGYHVGAILVEDEENPPDSRRFPYKFNGISGYAVQVVLNELELLQALVQKVREFDPDILLGYEVHKSSWGYIIDRAIGHYEYDILRELSRMKPGYVKTRYGREQDEHAYKQTCAMSTTGRMFFNVWRLMRSELTLTTYTLESTAFHVLHQRIPKFTAATLYSWYAGKGLKRWRSLTYYFERVQLTLDLLDDTSFLSRTCEFAKVYGIDLFSVISRGSQYRVESILSRITRPENFIHMSATKDQVRRMRAIECLPLNMEPVTKFYKDPLAVLDFQSLYPSVMIGYNMCFSTCLGRLVDIGSPKQFGVMDSLNVPIDVVEALKEHLIITQNGVVFVKHYVREGALGRMLKEILETRVMVKASMKMYKGETALMRILEARQLSLKLIANVTYGYAGASYSGRMPCAEIADSIVETGRRALQAGIKLAHDKASEWGGTVVYGDTDSMFVEFPGKSRESAFRIGQEMAHEISMLNPVPMKLKFEKIYHPCILLAKKRYVGFMYETLQDTIPQFDAKGIETVRRDGFPAMAKMVEDSLKLLFRTQDMSQLKAYLYRQWDRIMSNRISTIDLIIATEFKLKEYRVCLVNRNLPPGVAMCVQNMAYDKRTEPQGGERIPYVVCEARNTRYSGRSYSPLDLTIDRTLKPDGAVYVRKSIQALSRIFNLIGVDVEAWFNAMPKKNAATRFANDKHPSLQKGGTSSIRGGQFKIDQFYQSNHCILCSEMTINDSAILCEVCQSKRCQESIAQLHGQLSELQRKRDELLSVCRSCSLQTPGMAVKENKCVSVECPVLFVQAKATHEYLAMKDTLEKAISEVADA
ncbi:hypothetical protein BJ741DRAFT_536049 [Chytriomyces cf. hyalinus JEL632]|nr:hypothetical protein BJ741DRAFT_536049 [Chytriomyces cf. hyalinus JEL632]